MTSENQQNVYQYIAWDPETTLVFAFGQHFLEVEKKLQQESERYDTSGVIIEKAPEGWGWKIEHNQIGYTTAFLVENHS